MLVVYLGLILAAPLQSVPSNIGLNGNDYPRPEYFVQKLNHFDGSDTRTWLQAYYTNDNFWGGSESCAPVFLCVGGEGPALDGSAVVDSVHCTDAVELLQNTSAIMFAVEHRYYGCHNMSACPVQEFSNESLRYLSSRQALADLAQFHAYITKKYNLTPCNKWVSWGGSYPGMLAGWFRLKYPNLVHAAVASSAPVKAQIDMVGYNDVVAQAYSATSAGGSPDCLQAISVGHSMIGKMLNGSKSDRENLVKLFQLDVAPEQLTDVSLQRNFAGFGVFPFPAQSNDPLCQEDLCNIQKICVVMVNQSLGSEVERLAYLATHASEHTLKLLRQSEKMSMETHFRYQNKRLENAADENDDEPDFWGWQTCTEFAFYQTCERGSNCMFTQGLVNLIDVFPCAEFNISLDTVIENVDATNDYYGADQPIGTRVLFVNGEVDPWNSLSILTSPGRDLPTIWVTGASHHAWTHPSDPRDSSYLKIARTSIWNQVTKWLAEE